MNKLLFILLMTLNLAGFSQDKYITRTGHAYFISHTDIIDIDGDNYQVGSILNIKTGEMIFTVLMKSFQFTLALAEEHFNENYVESHKFPKATFKGKILNIEQIDLTKAGKYSVEVEGDLTIHGETNKIKEKGLLEVKGDKIYATSKFSIALKDYKIGIPKLVADKVAPIIPISINLEYELLNK